MTDDITPVLSNLQKENIDKVGNAGSLIKQRKNREGDIKQQRITERLTRVFI